MDSPTLQNLRSVEQRIRTAADRCGRDAAGIRLLPVSKTRPLEEIREVQRAGYQRFGENRVQEAYSKWQSSEQDPGLQWAVIGNLQRNKARFVAEFASEFQALDSVRVAAELDRRLQAQGRSLDVLVQVNSSGEPQKFGVAPGEVLQFTEELRAFSSLRVLGLMTLAVFSSETSRVAACFEVMGRVRQELQDRDGEGWEELSMGMSGDFELAIAHGATCVRVGQAIFGARLDPQAYWPGAG